MWGLKEIIEMNELAYQRAITKKGMIMQSTKETDEMENRSGKTVQQETTERGLQGVSGQEGNPSEHKVQGREIKASATLHPVQSRK
tara:strand:+ start:150 stop:407 length:258 start_codon:yes stop_codon:yes gene_type:complete